MSGSRRKANKLAPLDSFDWELGSKPNVVKATLNFTTNEVQVASIQTRTKRDNLDEDVWTMDTQSEWINTGKGKRKTPTSALTASEGDNWTNDSEKNTVLWDSKPKYEPLVTTAFKLNYDITNEEPVFSQVTDYTLFRQKPVIPLLDDILYPQSFANEMDNDSDRRLGFLPHVPVNRLKGAYNSVDHYLATHFELMRQDCVIPLQKAVQSYRATLSSHKQQSSLFGDMPDRYNSTPHRPTDYRNYEHVQLNAVVYGTRQVLYRISFRVPYYTGRVSWPTSKRLIEGTLVLLSKDNFEKDLKIATVVQRGDEPMTGSSRFEYMIDICLERDNPEDPFGFGDPSSNDQDTYVMLEATDGYFEAYRHILSVMKDIPVDDLPFKSYLVDVEKEVRIPYYASIKRIYDLDVSPKPMRSAKRKPVDIMNSTWPPYDIGMDKTQLDALQTILTNDISIIQGPPGTGKTYVGSYGMKVLLSNLDSQIGPIVCICQTNHALDQFLEHIINFEDRIVRVGGRSKSEILKDNLIYELRKTELNRGTGVGRLYRKRDEISKHIDAAITEMYEEPCVTLDFLTKNRLLRPRQLESLKRLGERENKRKQSTAENIDGVDSIDDDAWVVSSQPVASAAKTQVNSGNNHSGRNRGNKGKQQQQQQQGNKIAFDWNEGNPNHLAETEIKPTNPVEVWLQDAIEYVNQQGVLSSYSQDVKDALLEQQKGYHFEDEINENEFMDEEEVQEIVQNYGDGQDLRGNKSRFINIGRAYKKEADDNPVLRTAGSLFGSADASFGQLNKANDRKVVNYNKSTPRNTAAKKQIGFDDFDFFSDKPSIFSGQKSSIGNDDSFDGDEQHEVLERWMKDDDVTLWPLSVRLKAHKRWATLRNQHMQQQLMALVQQYNQVSLELRKANVLNDAQICRANRVVGMTSTAAAKYHDLLEAMRPSILVVEEAAEMLESHIVTALTSSLQHLILIGDHQQLRPSTAVHALSEHHHLNVSLFERLVINELPYTRLSHQRRMRPEIRSLINPIYSNPPLQDHAQVLKYPSVLGMERNVYFLAHEEPEEHMSETASKCNIHEAEMAAKLSRYLLLQGYSPKDITIITMYAGQRSTIQKQLRLVRRTDCDTPSILVSSVDGYQGEENKIIILSLVRSNTNGQIGFLKVANRVCVGLSRAKHGMYILGNARLLCDKSNLWNEIVSNMEDGGTDVISTTLGFKCEVHGNITKVRWPVDFSEVEEGGCGRACGTVLDCGHQCPLKCHTYDHDDIRCHERCRKVFTECRHQCTRQCSIDCGSCIVNVQLLLACGHSLQGDCSKVRRDIKAQQGKCRDCFVKGH